MPDKRVKKLLTLISILLFFLIFAAVFFSRSPILIVTDTSFDRLYGSVRLRQKVSSISREFFCRVIPVTVSESAGPDLIAIAVETVSPKPRAVLFPYRYMEGARFYKNNRPDAPVLVIGGGNTSVSEESALTYVTTDTVTDIYRAGLCAAFLAGDERALFFSDGILPGQYREAFREGLRFRGSLADPIFINATVDYSSFTGVGCVVVAGPAVRFLDRNLKIPVILFSWTDPGLTPRTVKIVFDDSPWALAAEAIRSLPSAGGEILLSSAPEVLKDRIGEKKDFRLLGDFVKEEFEKNENN